MNHQDGLVEVILRYTNKLCCLTITLDKTCRVEETTAAHVSSADVSKAKTENLRARTWSVRIEESKRLAIDSIYICDENLWFYMS